MNRQQFVSILWDASAKPNLNLTGFQVVKAIQGAAQTLGFVKDFKYYIDAGSYDAPLPAFRSQVQCSGVTLVDTASNGRIGSATKMIIVDAFVNALDNPASTHTILIVSVDPDVCYAVSLLRARGYQVYILCPLNSHSNLTEFGLDVEFDRTVLLDQADIWKQDSPSGHLPNDRSRRLSFQVTEKHSSNRPDPSEPEILPTPTIQAFREDFKASSGVGRYSAPSRSVSMTPDSSRSSSSNSRNRVFRTPKARVDIDDEDEFVSITPLNLPEDLKSQLEGTPDTTSSSLSFKSTSSGYFTIQPTLSTVAETSSLTPSSSGSSGKGLNGAKRPLFPQQPPIIRVEKVVSSTSTGTVKAVTSNNPQLPVPRTSVDGGDRTGVVVAPSDTQDAIQIPVLPPPTQPAPQKTPVPPMSPPFPPSTQQHVPQRTATSTSPRPPPPPSQVSTSAPAPSTYLNGGNGMPSSGIPIALKPAPASTPSTSTSAKLTTPLPPTQSKHAAPLSAAAKPPSSSVAPPPPLSAAPPVPAIFSPLVTVMREFHKQSKKHINRSVLGGLLPKRDPNIYSRAGFNSKNKFARYLDAAIEAGIIVNVTNDIVALNPAFVV